MNFQLDRFVAAQAGVYTAVVKELRAARKDGHWMWFIFPQLQGLGCSAMAQRYALASLAEAHAYLSHEVLGVRLYECTRLVCELNLNRIEALFHYPDYLKFHSCMTLFALAAEALPDAVVRNGEEQWFSKALRQYFAGECDQKTLALLRMPSLDLK